MVHFGGGSSVRRLVGSSLVLVLLGSLIPVASVSAAASVTAALGGNAISADTNAATGSATYTALTGPVVNGTANGDIGNGTIILTLPAGFEFKAGVGAAGTSGAGCSGLVASAVSYSASNTKATTTLSSGPTSGACAVTFTGLQVRPTTGTPVGSGNITNTGAAAAAPGGATNYGTLTIVNGVANKLAFSAYPTTNTPALLTPQPIVRVTDVAGNTVTTDTGRNITITTQNPGTFNCGVSTTRSTVNGIATFTGCTQSTVAGGYFLTADDGAGGLPAIIGPTFNVTSGLAAKLLLCWGSAAVCNTTPPSPVVGGAAFTTQPTVRITDAAGNIVTSDSATVVTLSILTGTPTSGGPGTLTCTGGNTATAVNGVAAFAGCAIDKVGVAYRLNAVSNPVLTSAQSNAFNVVAGPPVKLTFVVQPPASATAGAPFPGNIQVAITDAGANVVTTGITATLNLAIGTNPGGGTLACTGGNNATTTSGVATFTGCTINNQGNGYTLIASAVATAPVTALAPATSTAINVLAPAAAITLSAPAVITWGNDMTVNVHFGVNGSGKVVTIQVSKDGLNWSNISGATLTTNSNGDASFIYGPSDNRYYRASFTGTPDLQAGTSKVVRTVVRQINVLRPAPSTIYRSINRGAAITFVSTIRPNRPELPQATAHFVVYQLQVSGWVQVLDRMVPVNRADGKATLQVTFNTAGRFYVRTEAVPTPFNANSGWSGLVRYAVR